MLDLFSKFKELFKNRDKKKVIQNSVIIIIIGIIVVLAGNTLFPRDGVKSAEETANDSGGGTEVPSSVVMNYDDEESRLEQKLKDILKKVEGVGDTDVMITYETGVENVPAYDTGRNESTTTENDGDGGTRSIQQRDDTSSIVFEDDQNGVTSPVILKEIKPVVKGVLVVAEGAGDPTVQERIFASVQTLFDIPVHRIQVVEMKD